MKLYVVMLTLIFTAACSTTVTGPITKNKYNLDVGCTDNMRDYHRAREQAISNNIKKSQTDKVKLDCSVTE